MCKKIGIAAIVVLAGLFVLNKTKLGDWARYGIHQAKEAINRSVSPEMEINRLEFELTQLQPEIDKNLDTLASLRVEVNDLQGKVSNGRVALEKRYNGLKQAKKDIEAEVVKTNNRGQKMTLADQKSAWASDYETYKTAKQTLESNENLLKAKDNQVASLEAQIKKWTNLRDQMKAEIEQIKADLQVLKIKEAENNITDFDNTRLTRFQDSLNELKKNIKVRVERTKVAEEFNGKTPTGATKIESADRALKEFDGEEAPVASK
jgi:chromosome segregation ATPase